MVRQPPPLPKPRSRTESFILLTNPAAQESRPEFRPSSRETTTQISNVVEPAVVEREQKVNGTPVFVEEEAKVEPIPERPVDLYKVLSLCIVFHFISHILVQTVPLSLISVHSF